MCNEFVSSKRLKLNWIVAKMKIRNCDWSNVMGAKRTKKNKSLLLNQNVGTQSLPKYNIKYISWCRVYNLIL